MSSARLIEQSLTEDCKMEQSAKTKIRLNEVTLMRSILALLIVFTHAFTCYNGSWHQPEGYVDIPLYKWLTRASFAFALEAFVFISGYLFAFQRITLHRTDGFLSLTLNKLKRLILPSIIFSFLYFVLFEQYKGMGNMLYSIINGCGHMWFLPMLFWCFIGAWLLINLKISDGWKLALLAVLNLVAIIPLPLRFTNSASFLFFFYLGFLFYKYRTIVERVISPRSIVSLWLAFIVSFVLLRPFVDWLENVTVIDTFQKVIIAIGKNVCQLVFASIGVIAFYCTSYYYVQKHPLSRATIIVSACCFGIYIFQQFILLGAYYYTGLPTVVGPYWLPWCGFIIAGIISFVLTTILLKTQIGRVLIG